MASLRTQSSFEMAAQRSRGTYSATVGKNAYETVARSRPAPSEISDSFSSAYPGPSRARCHHPTLPITHVPFRSALLIFIHNPCSFYPPTVVLGLPLSAGLHFVIVRVGWPSEHSVHVRPALTFGSRNCDRGRKNNDRR